MRLSLNTEEWTRVIKDLRAQVGDERARILIQRKIEDPSYGRAWCFFCSLYNKTSEDDHLGKMGICPGCPYKKLLIPTEKAYRDGGKLPCSRIKELFNEDIDVDEISYEEQRVKDYTFCLRIFDEMVGCKP